MSGLCFLQHLVCNNRMYVEAFIKDVLKVRDV